MTKFRDDRVNGKCEHTNSSNAKFHAENFLFLMFTENRGRCGDLRGHLHPASANSARSTRIHSYNVDLFKERQNFISWPLTWQKRGSWPLLNFKALHKNSISAIENFRVALTIFSTFLHQCGAMGQTFACLQKRST